MGPLLGVIRSSEGIPHISHWYWELLVELVVSEPRWRLESRVNYGLNIAESLVEAREWDKLEQFLGNLSVFDKMTILGEVEVVAGGRGHGCSLGGGI